MYKGQANECVHCNLDNTMDAAFASLTPEKRKEINEVLASDKKKSLALFDTFAKDKENIKSNKDNKGDAFADIAYEVHTLDSAGGQLMAAACKMSYTSKEEARAAMNNVLDCVTLLAKYSKQRGEDHITNQIYNFFDLCFGGSINGRPSELGNIWTKTMAGKTKVLSPLVWSCFLEFKFTNELVAEIVSSHKDKVNFIDNFKKWIQFIVAHCCATNTPHDENTVDALMRFVGQPLFIHESMNTDRVHLGVHIDITVQEWVRYEFFKTLWRTKPTGKTVRLFEIMMSYYPLFRPYRSTEAFDDHCRDLACQTAASQGKSSNRVTVLPHGGGENTIYVGTHGGKKRRVLRAGFVDRCM